MKVLVISLSSCRFISLAPGEGDLELPRVCVQGCHRCSCSEGFTHTRGEESLPCGALVQLSAGLSNAEIWTG